MASDRAPKIPPGPKGRWRPTFRLLRDPRKAFTQWSQRYGDPFLVHALNGPVVITGRPDLVRQIFSHDPADYDVFAPQTGVPILGAGSMLVMSGEPHRRERKLVMPMFHGDRMRAYADIMQSSAIEAMDGKRTGDVIDVQEMTTTISLRIIVEAVFGGEKADPVKKLVELSSLAMRRTKPILLFSRHSHVRFLGISPWDRFQQSKRALHEAFDAELARRREHPMHREDILTLLTQARYEDGSPIDSDHARDELGTFLFAGHETSAIAIAWAIYHLHRNRDSLAQLKSELANREDDSPEAFAKLPYLKAVIQETLRLNPIVPEVLRVLKSPMCLDGFELPAGTAVAPAAILAHYREATFPDPNSFRPERFQHQTFSSSEYFPFGGGHRRCAGAAFATYEISIVLGTLLSRCDLQLVDERPIEPKRRNVTMGPSRPIRMKVLSVKR